MSQPILVVSGYRTLSPDLKVSAGLIGYQHSHQQLFYAGSPFPIQICTVAKHFNLKPVLLQELNNITSFELLLELATTELTL